MRIDSTKKVQYSSGSNITYETGEPNEAVNMDTDDDESEIDDGEEEKRVRRRFHHEDIIPKSTAEETEPVKQSSVTNDAEKKKKPIIELILPQSLRQTRVISILNMRRLSNSQSHFRQKKVYQYRQIMVSVD